MSKTPDPAGPVAAATSSVAAAPSSAAVASHTGVVSPWLAAAPAVFVLLWSSGFLGAKYGLPYAPPATFLLLRFLIVIALMVPIALLVRASWPTSVRQTGHICVAGLLVQAGYLGGVYFAIDRGMSAGLVALIVGLQPIVTAMFAAPLFGERVSGRQWAGLMLGLGGTALVVGDKLSAAGLPVGAIGFSVIGLLSITFGTLYQKRFCGNFDLRSGSVIQFIVAALVIAPFAWLETRPVEWTVQFVGALGHLVVVLSIIAISILAIMIRRGAATKVASLFYLVPPVTALIAFAMFGERLTGLAILGMAASVVGVFLVVRQ